MTTGGRGRGMRAVELAALLERIDQGVSRLHDRDDDLDKRLRSVETRSDTTAQVARIERVVDQLLATINERFKDVDKETDKRFAAMNKRFESIDARLRIIDRWRWITAASMGGAGTALGFAIRNASVLGLFGQ
ncbi:MAG: hypothetical protein V4515_04515 [Chloroflexota bacterium]